MLKTILMMYITLIPPIIAGILTMIWCKLSILKKIQIPIDFGKNFVDKKRIFGNNKTWKGLLGYIIFNIASTIIWGLLCDLFNINKLNFFYINYQNTLSLNILIGFLLGLSYALFELPNSFLKRRLNISPGKNPEGLKKVLFIFLDQADSVFGCCLIVCLFYNLGIKLYIIYVFIGAFTHIILNMILYFLRLRKNMF